MKIGIYYPSGHSTFDRAVNYFRQSLAKVAGENTHIRFTVNDGHLYLQGIQLDTCYFFVEEFKETLASLAIRHLDIDKDIMPGDIQTFIRSLITYRAKLKSTKTFTQIALEDLPLSVRIAQTEYLSSDVQADSGLDTEDPAQRTMEVFLESIDNGGLTSKQRDQCRQLLGSILRSPNLSSKDQKHLPNVTWSDVESLILSLVAPKEKQSNRTSAKSEKNLNALASILSSLNETAIDESPTSAIDLLVSLVKKNTDGTALVKETDNKKKHAHNDRTEHLSTSEIKRFVEKNTRSYIFEKYLAQHNRCEILTITLLLLTHSLSLQAKYRLQQILTEVLTGPIQEIEWDTIASGIEYLLKSQDCNWLNVNLMMIIEPLRRSEYSTPLYLLEQVSRNCGPAELNLLLPFIINEMLVIGREADYEVFEELCEMVLYLPASDINEIIPLLEKLDAFSEQKIAQNLFYSMPAKFYPIFAPLLHSSAGMLLARRAFQGFVNKPTDWLIDALLPVLDITNVLHLKFLYEYLKIGEHDRPTSTLKTLAGQIVVQTLPELSEDKRNDLAIIRTIKAVPRLKGASRHQVLERIVSSRYLLVIPDWPLNCRKAAREAMELLDESKRSRI